MWVSKTRIIAGVLTTALSGFFGAALVFVLSPVLLLLAGSSPEGGAYTNLELGFSLLASAGASCCVAGLVSNVYRTLDLALSGDSLFLWVRIAPEPTPAPKPRARESVLPVVTPSLVLPTLLSGLGGWVGFIMRAPRAEAQPSAA